MEEPQVQPEIMEGIPEQVDPEAPEVYVPPGGGVVYAPGVQSSGRLDLQLLRERTGTAR